LGGRGIFPLAVGFPGMWHEVGGNTAVFVTCPAGYNFGSFAA
jgi:hypothetical protein